jgi:hypothetical protein
VKPVNIKPLALAPLTYRAARAFVQEHHRHHKPPQGWLFGCAVKSDGMMVGVVMVGRPVARSLDDGMTAEVTRLCVLDGFPNACSMLYGAAWRAAKSLGYVRMVTYILAEEHGRSVRAAGWTMTSRTHGDTWNRPGRAREDDQPTGPKARYEIRA